MKLKILIIPVAAIILNACSLLQGISYETPEITVMENPKFKKIAVLDFSIEVANLSEDYSAYIEEEFTIQLAKDTNYFAVDRKLVEEAKNSLGIPGGKELTGSELVDLGKKLKVDFILTGDLWQADNINTLHFASAQKVKLRAKLLSIPDLRIAAAIKSGMKYENFSLGFIDKLIKNCIEALSEEL